MAAKGSHTKVNPRPALDAFAPTSVRVGRPTVASALAPLSAGRLLDLSRLFGCEIREAPAGKDGKERLAGKLAEVLGSRLPALFRELGRDELRAVCRKQGLDPSARARADLQAPAMLPPRAHPSTRNASSSRPSARAPRRDRGADARRYGP